MSIFGGGSKSAAQTPKKAMGLDLQGAQYGSPIPVVFGQNKVAGNVIWYGDFQAIGHQQKQPGKGGGGGSSGTTYTYSSSYMLGLCEGPASIVNVYDGSSVKSLSSVGGIGFTGTLGQAPWAHLSGVQAIGYSGTALAAFQNKDLGGSASLPNYNFEMAGRNQFGSGILDANPADIVTAICTDTQIGVAFNALGDLTQFKSYCTAAGIFFSPVYATQQSAQQTLDDLFKYSNSAPFFSEGVLKVVPYGDTTITGNGVTFTPNVTAVVDLGRDDFITNGPGDPVTVKRIGPADAMNIERVEFKDRSNTYHTSTVIASIDQDVVGTGARADQTDSVDMITTAAVARLVAQNLLQRTYYIRNTYEFQLSWRYCYLEPMDVVTLTDANTGLYLNPVRITEISEDEHGLLSVVAEEFPDGVSHGGIYATQANAGATVDTNADPGAIDGPYLFRGPGFLVSNNQPEIWCALSGNDPMWAGCDVYMSHDGTSYTYLTTHSRRASYGTTTNALPSVADPDTTSAPNVVLNGPAQLLGGTTADADQFITLAMVDQEIIAYQTATLASGPSYTLGYLRRGGYGSAIAAHASGAPFVRLDENILRIPVDPSQIGQTVYLKFVSFNVFGKGGRTLADETAYTYVIGTNVELPDVPLTPASFTATGVADGVSLTWTNPNPAAVGCTSIEYATASGGPWTVLAQEGPTATSFSHHFTNGATYFYRARSRGPLVAAGFSAYTATVSNTGTNVGAISTTANTAQSVALQVPIVNPNFDATPAGYGWVADSGSGWVTDMTGITPGGQPGCAKHVGGSGSAAGSYRNIARAPCQPGQVVKFQALIQAVSANGYCTPTISFQNIAGTEITFAAGNILVTGTTTVGSFATATAPAGTVCVVMQLTVSGHTSGTYLCDNTATNMQPSNIDEVPDGPINARTLGTRVNGGKPVIDFGESIHFNKNLSNVADGGGRFAAAEAGANVTETRTSALTASLSNQTQDNLASGAVYAQMMKSATAETVDNPDFEASATILPPPGWISGGGVTSGYTTGSAYSGAQSLILTATSTFGLLSSVRQYPCIPGEQYLVSAAIANNAVSGNTSSVYMQFFDKTGTSLSFGGVSNALAPGTGYQVLTQLVTVPANAVTFRLDLILSGVSSGQSLFDNIRLSRARSIDTEVRDGTIYGRTSQTDLYVSGGVNRVGLRIAGSGQRIGDQRNLVQRTVTNVAAKVPTVITYSSAAGTPATATISIAAFTVLAGSVSTAYSAMSASTTGTNGTTITYYLYFDDPSFAGGTQTLVATTNGNDCYAGDGRVYAGSTAVTYPTSGSGSGSGGGGGACVCDDMLIDYDTTAGEAPLGHLFDCLDIPTQGLRKFRRRLQAVEYAVVACVRLTTDAGAILECSTTTPFDLPEGGMAYAPEMQGQQVVTDRGVEIVARVDDIGERRVCHIHLGGCSYAAGSDPAHRIYSHNLIAKP
ncbi:hypothetical protein RHOFW104T7_13190 [Rhodanobacter thiooxydans]|uniref:Uncharacterized protein n=1 Tax=Rhodanobacter thiooxydans TaxID=416169 RepID=A0A154QH99_9GAMM|nr:phage tail protein [Rhodanobacter thiooxydans]KZC23551.1 hypothetical protein RHOFW104T7_13190 [Rhodanobacter thiooxydans]